MPFLRIGRVAHIEVTGIPTRECQVCHEQLYNLDALARIENTLHRRIAGHTETQYTFEQLTELTA